MEVDVEYQQPAAGAVNRNEVKFIRKEVAMTIHRNRLKCEQLPFT